MAFLYYEMLPLRAAALLHGHTCRALMLLPRDCRYRDFGKPPLHEHIIARHFVGLDDEPFITPLGFRTAAQRKYAV